MSHIIQHYNNEADIWRDAWRIADPGAANPVAVARTLFAASSFLLHKTGTDGVRKHPALRVIAGQLSFLYGVDRLGPSTEDLDKVRSVATTFVQAMTSTWPSPMHMQTWRPPMPDIGGNINWRYQLIATCRRDKP